MLRPFVRWWNRSNGFGVHGVARLRQRRNARVASVCWGARGDGGGGGDGRPRGERVPGERQRSTTRRDGRLTDIVRGTATAASLCARVCVCVCACVAAAVTTTTVVCRVYNIIVVSRTLTYKVHAGARWRLDAPPLRAGEVALRLPLPDPPPPFPDARPPDRQPPFAFPRRSS